MTIREEALPLPASAWPSVPTGYPGCIGFGEIWREGYNNNDKITSWPMFPQSAAFVTMAPSFDAVSASPTNITAGINNRASARFARATGDGLIARWTETNGISGLTIVVVVQFLNVLGVGTTQRVIRGTCPTNGNDLFTIGLQDGAWLIGGARLSADAFAAFPGTPAVVAGATYLVQTTFDYAHATADLWINGTHISTINPFQTAGQTEVGNGGNTPLLIGAGPNRPNDTADAYIPYWAAWRRAYTKASFPSLLPPVATYYGAPYA